VGQSRRANTISGSRAVTLLPCQLLFSRLPGLRDISRRGMPLICFGEFSLDTGTFELQRKSERVRIQQQPARILALLATNPGTLVTRNQIRTAIWGHETFVDFEQSLNFRIRQIRIALSDDAERPAFIETLPRLGYRFITASRPDGKYDRPAIAHRSRPATCRFRPQTKCERRRRRFRIVQKRVSPGLRAAGLGQTRGGGNLGSAAACMTCAIEACCGRRRTRGRTRIWRRSRMKLRCESANRWR